MLLSYERWVRKGKRKTIGIKEIIFHKGVQIISAKIESREHM